jgi:hypothetical protein
MVEIDAVVEVLKDELTDIWNDDEKDEKSRLGDIGESFVKVAIKQSMFDKGYNNREKGKGTFRVYKQVNADNGGRGGIDFVVEYTDNKGVTSECLVEVKNWDNYSISKKTYETEIKDRFSIVDPLNNKNRAVAIPKHHTTNINIKDECPKDKITVISMDQQITQATINRNEIKTTFKNFKKEIDKCTDDFIPDIKKGNTNSIKDDILQCKDYEVLSRKWDVTIEHLRNVASKQDVPDRRRKSWKVFSFIRYDEV